MDQAAPVVKVYGCHNRDDYHEAYLAMDGLTDIMPRRAVINLVRIPFTGSRSCQYRLTELGKCDPKCNDCARKKEPQ
jgi:hypothetical protein